MAKSAIEWIEVTWNPVTGCDKTPAGCDNCYALTLSKRLKAMGAGIRTHPKSLLQPYSWKKPATVFVNSMSDLFHTNRCPR